MLDYDTTMRLGAAGYRDVLDALDAAGWPAVFIQTGGMNAALLIRLETGQVLLITDADDALSRNRADKDGWGIALYPDEDFGDGPQAHDSCASTGTAELLDLIRGLLRRHYQPRLSRPRTT
jgi:hypothetical protein